MVERTGTIALEEGWHAIRVEFFERGGGAGLIVLAGGPETPYGVIAADHWMHGGFATSPADLNLDGFVDGEDLTVLLGQWGGKGNADFDQSGFVDGADLTFLLAEWRPE